MPLKCCVPYCKSNYDTTSEKVPVYRFPKDSDECDKWCKAIPRANLKLTYWTVVCRKHWPQSCKLKCSRGKFYPVDPPSVFEGIPKSCLTTTKECARQTKHALPSARNHQPDEIDLFLKQDAIDFNVLETKLADKKVVVFKVNNSYFIQSQKFVQGSTPLFAVKLGEDFSFEAYHCGVLSSIPTLVSNKVYVCKTWSCLEEILRFLSNKLIDHKKTVMLESLNALGAKKVGHKLYSPAAIVQGFEYFATSRALYSKLVKDFPLPSIRTLTRLTAKVDKIEDISFIKNVLNQLPPEQRCCILLVDEVYIKPSLTYHGGRVFGKAVDHSDKLAKTVCCIMVKCLFGGPEFIVKLLPVSNLTSDFLYSQFQPITNAINEVENAQVLAIIADGHQVNQKLFHLLNSVPEKPWLGRNSTFLLFDYVHLFKSIRNNWISEKCGQLEFNFEGNRYVASWDHIRQLFNSESENLLRLSKLTYSAVFPSPIEKQRVALCLQVFCDETIAALETFAGLHNIDAHGTILFLKLIVKFWKFVNVHNKNMDLRANDDRQAVVVSVDDERLLYLQAIGEMAHQMTSTNRTRIRQLTKETGSMLAHTCKALVHLAQHLLELKKEYVILGWFTTDPLEKYFSKLRQGSGGTYFINAQSVIEKVRIHHAKLALRLDLSITTADADEHQCNICNRELTVEETEVFDSFFSLEESLAADTLNSIVYMGGYVESRFPKTNEDTRYYYQRHGKYLDLLNRGKLTIPGDCTVQWIVYCYIFFATSNSEVCRSFLINQFLFISERFSLAMHTRHARTLSNIFLKNAVVLQTPRSSREAAVKVLKLS